MIKKPKYDDLLSFDRIENVYHTIRTNTKHREKIVRFETYYSSNVIAIYTMLKSKCYKHGKYSIFLVYKIC